MRNKTTAAILAILLGGLGIHKFYLGKGLLGVLYLLFCWTLIPALIGLIDGIILLTMSEKQFNHIYNKASTPIPSAPIRQPKNVNVSEELEKFYALKEKGIITEEEFENKKKSLLHQ